MGCDTGYSKVAWASRPWIHERARSLTRRVTKSQPRSKKRRFFNEELATKTEVMEQGQRLRNFGHVAKPFMAFAAIGFHA